MIVGLVVVVNVTSACTSASVSATMPSAPARIYDVGHDVSDPFLTVGKGCYDLILSEGGAGVTMNVPVASGTTVGRWGAVTDVMPTLPAWAAPGCTWAPDLHRFGSTFVLYFISLVKSTSPAMEWKGAATGASLTGPYLATWMAPPSPPPSTAASPSTPGPTSTVRFAPPTS
jgi:hypothetical protein